jgi:hypothetical protein
MALGEFLDHFYTSSTSERLSSLRDEPQLHSDPRINALVAAVAEHLTKSYTAAAAPAWVEKSSRFIDDPWFTGPKTDLSLKEYLTWSSPAAFKRRNIMTDGSPLQRATTPRAP